MAFWVPGTCMAWRGIAGHTALPGPVYEVLARDALSPSLALWLEDVFVGERDSEAKSGPVPRGVSASNDSAVA